MNAGRFTGQSLEKMQLVSIFQTCPSYKINTPTASNDNLVVEHSLHVECQFAIEYIFNVLLNR